MARDISSGNYLIAGSAAATAVPISMACWYNIDTLGQTHLGICLGVAASLDNQFQLTGTVSNTIIARTRTTSNADAESSANYTSIGTGKWLHGAAVFASTTSRAAYLNGGNKGTNATSATPAGINRTTIGARPDGSSVADAKIAWPCIWNVALTDDEIASLAKGIHPLRIRPASIVFFAPLIGGSPEPELISRNEPALTGTPAFFEDVPVTRSRPLVYPIVTANTARSALGGKLTNSLLLQGLAR